MAVTYNGYKFVTVSLPKRLRNGGFTSETAARRFKKWNGRYETVSEVKRLQIYNGYM